MALSIKQFPGNEEFEVKWVKYQAAILKAATCHGMLLYLLIHETRFTAPTAEHPLSAGSHSRRNKLGQMIAALEAIHCEEGSVAVRGSCHHDHPYMSDGNVKSVRGTRQHNLSH